MDAERAAKKLDYTEPGMTRAQTVEAMLKACLDAIDDADSVVALQAARGYPYRGRWVDALAIRSYIGYPRS